MIRISELYHEYKKANNITAVPRLRLFISTTIAQYIKTYYSQKQKHINRLNIVDIGGGNGDVLTNIGKTLDIPKKHLFCLEPKNGWEYPYDNTKHIQYVFWNNRVFPPGIKPDSVDVVIIMVALHHMTDDTLKAVFDNLVKIVKPGSLLIIKEHDAQNAEDRKCIIWEHALYAIVNGPIATTKNIKEIRNYDEFYNSKTFYDEYIDQYGYVDAISTVLQNPPIRTNTNPTNLYWKVYIKE
jgi:SAM-dependent methyltransferase